MKKLFVIALAAIGMVACVQNEIVEAPKSDAIAFAGAYIDNATRAAVDPSFTTDQENALAAFNVWGYMDQTAGTVFAAEDVQKVNGAWSYANTQYWAPEHDYYFAALAPMDSANIQNLVLATDPDAQKGLGSFKFVNVAGGEDLIYAEAKVTTPGMNAILQNGMDPVQLQFNHLLSKVKFTFKNGFTTNNAYVEVKNIKMTVANNATIDLATDAPAWANLAGETELAFGNVANLAMGQSDECTDERLTIPATDAYTYDIQFTVVVYMGTVKALEVTKTSTVTGQAFEMGRAYNLVAEITPENLNLLPIEFDVVVKEWETPYVDVENKVGTVYASNAAELQAAINAATAENGYNIVVLGDILEDVTATQKDGVHLTIDGNDHKFVGTLYVDGDSSTNTNKSLTIKKFNFETTDATRDFINSSTDAIRYARNLTIEGCTFTGSGAGSEVVALRLRQAYGVVVKNCVGTDLHSLAQFTSHNNDATFVGVTVTESGRGVNFGNAVNNGKVLFENCNFEVSKPEGDGYGIRIQNAAEMTVNNSTINADQPLAFRLRATDVVNVNSSVLTAKVAGEKWFIIDKGVMPVLYVDGILWDGASQLIKVTTADELKAALAVTTAKTIILAENTNFAGTYVMTSNTTLAALEGASVGAINLNGADNVTINNVTFDATTAVMSYDYTGAAKQYANIYTGDKTNKALKGAHNLVIDGCTFTGTFANGGASIAFVDYKRTSGFSGNVTIKNCTFDTQNAYYNIYGYYCGDSTNGHGNFVIENNTFKTTFTQGGAIYLGRYASNVPVVVKGNTFEVATALNEAMFVQDHSSYGVSIAASNNTFAQ